jgi:hypothetical protein
MIGRAIVCDQCGMTEFESYNGPKTDWSSGTSGSVTFNTNHNIYTPYYEGRWFTLTQLNGPFTPLHFCSAMCISRYTEARAKDLDK